jgi:VanZ family protein
MRLAARVALLAWLGVVLALTLSPHNTRTQAQGDRVVAKAKRHVSLPGGASAEARHRDTDIIGNVLLFIPFGALGILAFPEHRRRVVIAGPLLSGAIEASQWAYLPQRTASLRDVATNATGHFIGVAAAVVVLYVGARSKNGTS